MSPPMRGSRRPHVVPITAPSFPTFPRPRLYKNIAYTFVGLAVSVVIAVLWLSSVRASVVVHAKQTTIKLDDAVDVAKAPHEGQIAGRVVQGVFEKIQEFEVKNLAASSSEATASQDAARPPTSNDNVIAKGTVRILNTSGRAQTLVRTTRLLTPDQKLYRIDKTVNVPQGGEVEVGAYADQPGSEFVIGPVPRFTIPGLIEPLQKKIYAVSEAPFTAVPAPVSIKKPVAKPSAPAPIRKGVMVAQTHMDDAQKILTDAVFEQAKTALSSEVNDPRFGEAVYYVKLLDKKFNVSPGQTADTFLASVKLDVTAVYYPKDDMLALIRTKLKAKIPDGRELLPFEPSAVVYTLQLADAKSETASVRANLDAAYRLTEESPLLQKTLIAGKSKSEAESILKAVDGVDKVEITLKPSWFTKIPSLKDHIDVKVE